MHVHDELLLCLINFYVPSSFFHYFFINKIWLKKNNYMATFKKNKNIHEETDQRSLPCGLAIWIVFKKASLSNVFFIKIPPHANILLLHSNVTEGYDIVFFFFLHFVYIIICYLFTYISHERHATYYINEWRLVIKTFLAS